MANQNSGVFVSEESKGLEEIPASSKKGEKKSSISNHPSAFSNHKAGESKNMKLRKEEAETSI